MAKKNKEEVSEQLTGTRKEAKDKAAELLRNKRKREGKPRRAIRVDRAEQASDVDFERDEDGRLYAMASPPELVYAVVAPHVFSEVTFNVILLELSKGKSMAWAANAAGVSRRTIDEWRRKNEQFDQACVEAIDIGTDFIEDEMHRRAVQGVLKPVYQGGVMVGTVVEYSDRMMELTLKARRPEKYRERFDVKSATTIILKAEPGDDKL